MNNWKNPVNAILNKRSQSLSLSCILSNVFSAEFNIKTFKARKAKHFFLK